MAMGSVTAARAAYARAASMLDEAAAEAAQLEEFTAKDKWLGGYADDVTGEPVRSKETLKAEMEARGFSKIHEDQYPLLIREHQRKYQYIVSEVTAWQKAE